MLCYLPVAGSKVKLGCKNKIGISRTMGRPFPAFFQEPAGVFGVLLVIDRADGISAH